MTKKKKQKNKEKTLINKMIDFIKYHNAFTIGLVLFVVVSGSAMASEGVRDAVLGEKTVQRQGIDNTMILSADIDNFDFQMSIHKVTEDKENYHIEYSYNTMAIQDNIWQQVFKEGILTVSKSALAGRDLGLYVTEELGEIIDNQFSYLKEVQEIENQKGITLVQETTKYNGLVGLVMNTKTKELPGYEPIVKPVEPQILTYMDQRKSDPEPNNDQSSVINDDPEPEPEPNNDQSAPEPNNNPSPVINNESTSVATTTESGGSPTSTESEEFTPDLPAGEDGSGEGEEPDPNIEIEPIATTTEPITTTTESGGSPTSTEIATTTEPVCQPTEEICDGIDNNCDGNIDENCDCGISSCDSSLNLFGECQNSCLGVEGCGTCEPTCGCADGWTDCDADMSNGCEVQGECVVGVIEPEPTPEPEPAGEPIPEPN